MIEHLRSWLRDVSYRYRFGRKYKLGLLPDRKVINNYIYEHATLIGKHKIDHGVYTMGGKVYNMYQRNEVGTRYSYDLDGVEYARIEIERKNG